MRPDNRVRDAGVAGSNPATPTNYLCHSFFRLFLIAGGSRVNRGFPSEAEHRSAFQRRMASAAAHGVRGLPVSPPKSESAANAGYAPHPRSRVLLYLVGPLGRSFSMPLLAVLLLALLTVLPASAQVA